MKEKKVNYNLFVKQQFVKEVESNWDYVKMLIKMILNC